MSWLTTYLDYTDEQESPTIFHLWAGIAAMGHVLGRRVWLNRYFYRLFPCQIMVVLVSGSAVTRKSTAVNMAARLLRFLPEHAINIAPDLTSTESFLEGLSRMDPETGEPLDAVGLIVNDELGTFLSRATYAETLLAQLNKLNTFDGEHMEIKFRSWRVDLKRPSIGMLAATTPIGFSDELPRAAKSGGFMGRILPVYAEEPKHANPLVEPPRDQRKRQMELIRGLRRVSQLSGEFQYRADAKRWFVRWYEKHQAWVRRHCADEDRESGWQARLHDHLLRVAMVLAASEGNTLELTSQHMQAALTLLEGLGQHMSKITDEVGTRAAYNNVQRRIIKILHGGEQSWSYLLQRMSRYAKTMELRDEVVALVDQGLVKQYKRGKGWWYVIRPDQAKRAERIMRAHDDDPADGTHDGGNIVLVDAD